MGASYLLMVVGIKNIIEREETVECGLASSGLKSCVFKYVGDLFYLFLRRI